MTNQPGEYKSELKSVLNFFFTLKHNQNIRVVSIIKLNSKKVLKLELNGKRKN